MADKEFNYPDLISAYLQGNATAAQKDKLYEWASANEDNYKTFLQIKNLWEIEHPAFSEAAVEEMKNSDKIRVLSSCRSTKRKPRISFSRIAAVLFIPLCLSIMLLAVKNQRLLEKRSTMQSISCSYGTVTTFTLPDGSYVHLNSGSEITFPDSFESNERRVKLTGEAFFEVVSDDSHPFIVSSGDMDVIATGTEFNVEAYPGYDTRITLVSGIVNVVKNAAKYSLKKGHQLQFAEDGSVTNSKTDTFKWTAWKDGVIAFRADRLSYVFERLAQTYNANIIIEDPEIAEYQIRATFKEERLDEIMALIERCAPIRCVRKSGSESDSFSTEYHIYLDK